jgi:selenocysteine lyase/cysteine desulfurase
MEMLPSQRALFDMPREICFLNAASWSPMPLAVQTAGREGVARKGRPWQLDTTFAARQYERARAAAAHLINADPHDIALIPSVSYGVATAAKAVPVSPGTRVLVLEDDHASPVLEWTTRAETGGFVVETVKRPADGDWTDAIRGAVARPGAAPIALASISSVHWSDGGRVDLDRLAQLSQLGEKSQ